MHVIDMLPTLTLQPYVYNLSRNDVIQGQQ